MKTVMIIQARMGSTRLPGKSLMELAGHPLVGRILERVKRCASLDKIVLAIPNTKENEPLTELALEHDIEVFKGDEQNVLLRYCEAARYFAADYVVRLPADNPVPEPAEIDRIVDFHRALGRPGFSSNLAEIRNSGYPDGIGAEIFDASLLYDAIERAPTEEQKEHVHLNFYDYASDRAVDEKWCPIGVVECPAEISRPDLVLDVNTHDQYLFMRDLYHALYPDNPHFGVREIISWCDSRTVTNDKK